MPREVLPKVLDAPREVLKAQVVDPRRLCDLQACPEAPVRTASRVNVVSKMQLMGIQMMANHQAPHCRHQRDGVLQVPAFETVRLEGG